MSIFESCTIARNVKTKPFVHLHLHTCYSLLDGACQIDRLVEAAAQQEMPALAMTDHGVMYGAVEFYNVTRKAGINPVIGCEVYITTGSRHARGDAAKQDRLHHLVLLAENNTGYSNLIRLVSLAHAEGMYYKPRIDREILARHSGGLIGLSACLKGQVAAGLVDGNMDSAVAAAEDYAGILGRGNFYLEAMDHGLPDQRKVAALLPELSKRTRLPIVATNDVHYLKREHARAHEVLLCLQTGTVLSDPKRMRYASDEFYLKSRDEMESLFRDFPGALDRTAEVAARCAVTFEENPRHFPVYVVPDGVNQEVFLRQRTAEGMARHYGIRDVDHPADDRERNLVARMDFELGVIKTTGFVNYFLVVWDFVRYARENRIPVGPGRGSGGGSLVAYALGITAMDPIRYDLIFERFLNPERVSPPDFDIDFCMDRRGEVIEYVKRKYGEENVAQIITFGSLGPKTVMRDVGRVLEVPYAVCDRLAKLIPDDPKTTLESALKDSPEFRDAAENDPDCKRILSHGFVLEGLYRNPGVHAAGVVIGEKPLIEIVPLGRDKENRPVTQFTKGPIEEVGLLKMDFLGLKTLTVLQEAVDLVRELKHVEIDIENLPLDDAKTYALLGRGDTVAVFQLESGGMRDLVRRTSPSRIEDLIAIVALYRPGPMNMLDDYIARKCGKTRIKYDHPLLEPVLRETYGVMVYQEQVQRAANVLAGYSLGKADKLRRAMGKKNPEEMATLRQSFVAGCKQTNGIDAELSGRIFDNIEKFAGYGFNKSHSAGYAIIAYQTAYMKANYPAEYMSAVLSGEIGNSDKLPVFIAEAQEMDLAVLPPDINRSAVRFRPEGAAIRFGLAGIKNVGTGAAEAIVAQCRSGGPYTGLVDFCARVDSQTVNKKVIESLARCGAMDTLGSNRARLFGGIDFAMARSQVAARDRKSGQGNLFSLLGAEAAGTESTDAGLPNCPPWHENELLAAERELLGMYMTGHPLTHYAWLLKTYQMASVAQLAEQPENTLTRVGGLISTLQKRLTKVSRDAMAVITLEGLDGSIEVVVFPDAYKRHAADIVEGNAVLVCGEVSRRDERVKIAAREVYRLEDAPRHFTVRVGIHIPAAMADDARLARIKEILRLHPGLTPVLLCLQFPSGERVFIRTDRAYAVMPSQALVRAIEQELGEAGIYVAVKPDACVHARSAGWHGSNGRNGA